MFTKPLLLALAAGLVIGAPVMAGQEADWQDDRPADASSPEANSLDYDYAQVTHVEPRYRQVRVSVPRQECYTERRYVPDRPNATDRPAAGGAILGGLIGAVIGHQFGYGDERAFGTVAGAVVGGVIGHEAARQRDDDGDERGYGDHGYGDREGRTVEGERCVTRYSERIDQRIDGYRVSYRYHDRNYQTDLPYDPGERLRVSVTVSPEGY
jgi:uncharacterized protein YcfJ